MRIFVLLAFVAVASGGLLNRRFPVPWDEWERELGVTGPETYIDSPSVCWGSSQDGTPIQVCCEGYTGSVEEGCTYVCNPPCQNGGTCAGPNFCVCNNAFSGEICNNVKREYEWSEWISIDTQNIIGDSELLFEIRRGLDVCKNVVPEAIECRPVDVQEDHITTSQVLTCDRRQGLKCRNDEQPDGSTCVDYEVRILCPVKATKTGFTCIHKAREYNSGEEVKEGDCLGCECLSDGRWECHRDEKFCDTLLSTTPAPMFAWLPTGVRSGQCTLGETVFNHGETTTLDCKECTCDSTTGWICETSDDPFCLAPAVDDYCRIDDHFIFFHGQTAKKNCNTCICKNSEWDCTQLICPDKSGRAPYHHRCVNPMTNDRHDDGEIVMRDCNVCVCTQGKWDCTQDACQEGVLGDSDLSLKKVCTTSSGLPFPHGATISVDCNACKCFDAQWQCTRRYCTPENYPNSTCVDELTTSLVKSGQTIRRGCDVCLCNGGNLTCTTKPCNIKPGACFDEQRRFTTTTTSFERQYRPFCNSDGTFNSIQCNPLHDVCFCVTTLGHIIPGTTRRRDAGTPSCSPYTMGNFPCTESNTDTARLSGYNTPKCLPNGYFAPMQCDNHTGVCYCVTPQGATVPNSVLHVSQGRPNCELTRADDTSSQTTTTTELKTPCQQEREKADQYKLPYLPECDQTGHYNTHQINELTRMHFCVDQNGVVLEWTIQKSPSLDCNRYRTYIQLEVQPFTNKVDSERSPLILQTYPVKDRIHKTPRCKLQRLISQHVPTVYQPTCEVDGRYRPEQCPQGTGVCFCVDVTGTTVPKTTRRSGEQSSNCNDYRSIYNVVTPANASTIMIHPPVSLEHSGWEPKLREVDHPNHLVGPQYKPSTAVVMKTNVPTCVRQQQIATMVPGVFHPSCQTNGSFSTMQHQPLSPEVYCVDKNGVKIDGTERRMDYELLPDCDKYWNTTLDITKVTKHWTSSQEDTMTTEPLSLDSLFPAGLHHHPNCTKQQELTSRLEGAVVPTCEPNGTYTPLQCNATTGVCYCMLPYGDVLPDTVLPMVKGTPNCWHLKRDPILQTTTPVPEVCKLPVVRGPCRARFIRWTFSSLLNRCQMFVYGGCRGNDNKFDTKEECDSMCGYLTPPTDPRPVTCERKLARFERLSFVQRLTMKRPVCTPEGNYKPMQCHLIRTEEGRVEKVCACVDEMTGEPRESCEEEEETMTREEERAIVQTTPSPAPEIEGCLSEGVTYHRGDDYFLDCNICFCIGNNQGSCTKRNCPSGVCYHHGQVLQLYERGCEECTCIGGSWDCEEKLNCSPDQRPVPEEGTATECVLDDGMSISVNSSYFNECNKCTCNSHGMVTCENAYCIPRHCYHMGQPYHNNERVMKDCNRCICFGGHWQCQEYTCDPIIRNMVRLEGCEYNGVSYSNGETFYEKCNLCNCLGNNATSCVRKSCNPTSCYVKDVEIKQGQTETIDCRSCTCFNGILDCQEGECTSVTAEPNVPQVNTDPTIKCNFEGKTYTNGDRFWKRCKPCRCYDDGQVRCEDNKFCSPNLCYEEGVAHTTQTVRLTETQQCTCYRGSHWQCQDKPQDAGPPDMIRCPNEHPAIACPTNPCDSTICPTHEEAICVPNFCGHCQPAFFDIFGNRLQC